MMFQAVASPTYMVMKTAMLAVPGSEIRGTASAAASAEAIPDPADPAAGRRPGHTEPEGERGDSVDVDANELGRGAVQRGRANGGAEGGAVQHQEERAQDGKAEQEAEDVHVGDVE